LGAVDVVFPRIFIASVAYLLSSCAVLHHVSVGEVRNLSSGKRFEIYISEMGINAEAIGSALDRGKDDRRGSELAQMLGLFQWGPRTGNVVYNKNAFDGLLTALTEKCPQGRVTGLVSIREMRNYHFASGEIVKVIGYCVGGG
jgi:hypothetical protein